MRLHRFHGGLRLDGHKAESTRAPPAPCPLAPLLKVALLQHAGLPAVACVEVGQRVVCGERIGRDESGAGADVHAPCAGEVRAIESLELPQFPAMAVEHIVIAPAPGASPHLMPPLHWQEIEPAQLRERIRAAGVVGLGGAGFPTAEKLAVGRELLVLNGAECEPWIACDDALLQAHADEVVLGGRLLARAAGATRIVLAIEDRMPAALAAAAAAIASVGEGAVELAAVPTRYPEGGERQLIQVLTGLEVPRGGLPRDIGVLVQNVATARAAWRAVTLGEPVTDRIITVTGPGVVAPGNFVVPLGTPIAHLVEQAGGYRDDAARLLLGGPMMGQALAHDQHPIGKQHNCVLVLTRDEVQDPRPEMPCIRCGDCASACPSRLLPQQLLWHLRAGYPDRAVEQGLFDCIECGCCDLVCPSLIPLTSQFKEAKSGIRRSAADALRAAAARERHEARQLRLERESAETARRHEARKADATSPDAVAAALERARAKRAALDQDSTS